MENERITVSTYPKKKVLRNRKRLGLTVAPDTIEKLKALVVDGEAENVSRAIDFVTGFFCKNRGAVQVSFADHAVKAAFTRAALAAGKTPGELLEALAIEFLKSSGT
jgi:hypothetical protein